MSNTNDSGNSSRVPHTPPSRPRHRHPQSPAAPADFKNPVMPGVADRGTGVEVGPASAEGPWVPDEVVDDRLRSLLRQQVPEVAADVDLVVSDGHVTLRGRVPDASSKHRVEAIVAAQHGVQDIHSELHTTP